MSLQVWFFPPFNFILAGWELKSIHAWLAERLKIFQGCCSSALCNSS